MVRLTSSDVIAAASVVVATCAFFVAIQQAASTRKHDRLSVCPNLDWFVARQTSQIATLSIKNCGLGPAVIDDFVIVFEGICYRVNESGLAPGIWEALSKAGCEANITLIGPESPLEAGCTVEIVAIPKAAENIEEHAAALQHLANIGLQIRYRSMYGQIFQLRCDCASP